MATSSRLNGLTHFHTCTSWAPGVTSDVFQLNEAVGPAFDVVKIGVAPPSSRTVQVIVPVPLLSLMPTVTGPLTVAPSPGLVNATVKGSWPFAMLTTRGALPVAPFESRTLAITVFGPSLNCFVFHPIEIGPDEVSVVGGATVAPSMVSV